MAFRVWMLGGNLPHFTLQDNPTSFSDCLSSHIMTYSYLIAFNSWLLLSLSVLSYDWQMGSIPLVDLLMDSQNLGTLMFAMIAVLLVYFAVFSNDTLVNSGFLIHLHFSSIILTFVKHRHALLFFGWVDELKHFKWCLHFYKRKEYYNRKEQECVE